MEGYQSTGLWKERSMTTSELHEKLKLLQNLSRHFPDGSDECKAVELAANAILFVFQEETRNAFLKFRMARDQPLTEAQILHLRAIGIDSESITHD
jgi:hypothetical protein